MPTLTLNLDDRHDEVLTRLASETGMSKTGVLRQALRLYQLVHERVKGGQQLAFTKDGRTVVVELIGPTLAHVSGVQSSDSERLEWLMRNVSGAEFRRMGIVYSAGCTRADIDAVAAGMPDPLTPKARPQDWGEDFSHENGNYQCLCCECGQVFIGHKRRVVCKTCASGVGSCGGVGP